MSDYRYVEPKQIVKSGYDPERKPFAHWSQPAPDRTGQYWWRGSADLNSNTHSCIFFKVIGPPRLMIKTVRDQNIIGEIEWSEEYDYIHPIEQIIPYTDYQYGRQWHEGYHSWESKDHGPSSPSPYERVNLGDMKIEEAWRHRVGQMWRRSDHKEQNIFSRKSPETWGNFVIVSTKINENTCTVVHDVVYVDGTKSTIVEHGGATQEKSWSMDTDRRFERIT